MGGFLRFQVEVISRVDGDLPQLLREQRRHTARKFTDGGFQTASIIIGRIGMRPELSTSLSHAQSRVENTIIVTKFLKGSFTRVVTSLSANAAEFLNLGKSYAAMSLYYEASSFLSSASP